MRIKAPEFYAVYCTPPTKGAADGTNAVCTQAEWEVMDAARPGVNTLIRGHIANEGEAERLARGTAGDSKARHHSRPIPPSVRAATPATSQRKVGYRP